MRQLVNKIETVLQFDWLANFVALYPGNLSLVVRPSLPLAFANCKRSKAEAQESLGARLDEASDLVLLYLLML